MSILLSGCAGQATTDDLWHGDLYISENGYHKISIDKDELYQFTYPIGKKELRKKFKKR